jgi:hypothetical protein
VARSGWQVWPNFCTNASNTAPVLMQYTFFLFKLKQLHHVAACVLLQCTPPQRAQMPLHRWWQLQSGYLLRNAGACWLLPHKTYTSAAASDTACQPACQRSAHTSSRDAELCRSAVSNEALLPCCRWASTHKYVRMVPQYCDIYTATYCCTYTATCADDHSQQQQQQQQQQRRRRQRAWVLAARRRGPMHQTAAHRVGLVGLVQPGEGAVLGAGDGGEGGAGGGHGGRRGAGGVQLGPDLRHDALHHSILAKFRHCWLRKLCEQRCESINQRRCCASSAGGLLRRQPPADGCTTMGGPRP